MKTKLLLSIVFGIILTSTAAMAQQSPANTALISRLEVARQDCEWKARNMKGSPQGKMLLHQRTMQNVLAQLKAGESLDQETVYKAFVNHSH